MYAFIVVIIRLLPKSVIFSLNLSSGCVNKRLQLFVPKVLKVFKSYCNPSKPTNLACQQWRRKGFTRATNTDV